MMFKWSKRPTPNQNQPSFSSDVGVEITHPFPEHHSSFDIFWVVTNLNASTKIIVEQSNFYTKQNGREFQTNEEEMKAFSTTLW